MLNPLVDKITFIMSFKNVFIDKFSPQNYVLFMEYFLYVKELFSFVGIQ